MVRSLGTEKKWKVIYVVGVFLWLFILSSTIYFSGGIHPIRPYAFDLTSITAVLLSINLLYILISLFVCLTYVVGINRVKKYQHQAMITAAAYDKSCVIPKRVCSIIIPAHNEEVVIRKSVLACLKQSYREIEVIVIAHNCTDKTLENAMVDDHRVRVFDLKTKESGKSVALNYGVTKATDDFILVIDADHELDERFLENAMPLLLKDNQYAAIQGNIRSINRGYNFVSRLAAMETDLWSEPFLTVRHLLGRRCPLCGTGFIIRKQVLNQVGGFSNNLVEDAELTYRLLRNKYRIAFAPLSVIQGEEPTSLEVVFRQRARWARGFLSLLRHRLEPTDLLGNLYWALPALSYLGYISIGIISFAALYYMLFGYVPYAYSFISLRLWLFLLGMNLAMFFILHLTLFGKKGLRYAVYLPAYMVYSQYSFSVAIKALFVRSWSQNKTAHGFTQKPEILKVRSQKDEKETLSG